MKSYRRLVGFVALVAVVAVLVWVYQIKRPGAAGPKGGSMQLSSPVFEQGRAIPAKYTCQGQDFNPPLAINGVPAAAKSLALVMDDPDAPGGTYDHWVVWNIPPATISIEENHEPRGVAGQNGWGKTGYGGPCPPSGTHNYHFKLYALDTELNLEAGSNKSELEAAMKPHIIEQTELVGTFTK